MYNGNDWINKVLYRLSFTLSATSGCLTIMGYKDKIYIM
jgi:hypothetical protein